MREGGIEGVARGGGCGWCERGLGRRGMLGVAVAWVKRRLAGEVC